MTDTLTITRPDDWHIHLRDGEALKHTVFDASQAFTRAIVMPNLVPPVTTAEMAMDYRDRILSVRPEGSNFTPLMVLYLTNNTTVEDVIKAKAAGVTAYKLYPAGATTNSAAGVTDLKALYPVLETMQKEGIRFLMHGEVTDPSIDIFDREKVFIDSTLQDLMRTFPELPMVLEHITTADAVTAVKESTTKLAATITAHHLLYNRNHMLVGGIRPDYYCLPILKRNKHQEALIEAATSGDPRFFLGTDSAPHPKHAKHSACGCAGCYTAYAAMELYAEAFEKAGALDKLEAFASFFGPDFYGLPRNTDTITLVKQSWTAPEELPLHAEAPVVPLRAGETLHWQLKRD